MDGPDFAGHAVFRTGCQRRWRCPRVGAEIAAGAKGGDAENRDGHKGSAQYGQYETHPAQPRKAESPQANTNRTTSSSRLGSVMRGVGLFAGGMFLGSMLSHFFGWGSLAGAPTSSDC